MKELICDLHIHSTYSDGQLSIPEIVDLYGSKNFSVIAITDHFCETTNLVGQISHTLNYSLSEKNFKNYMEEIRKEGERAWKQYGMLLLPGYEITKNSFVNNRSAHLLIIGTENLISPNLSIPKILQQAKEQEALTIAAHPFYTGDFEFQTYQLWSRKEELGKWIDLWEVNIRHKISREILTSGLPLVANSDFHRPQHLHSWKTKVYSKLEKDALFAAYRAQKVDFFI